MRWFSPGPLVVWLACTGCRCSDDVPPPPPKAAAPSSSETAQVATEPPTPSETVGFASTDGFPLTGTFFESADKNAPLVVFIHRFRGDSSEWQPLAERLALAPKRANLLNFDLRGHGASAASADGKPQDWTTLAPKDVPLLVRDVRGAIDYGLKRIGVDGGARVILVGSSLGAALAAQAASEDERVVALALVSPGAAIHGYDVFTRFARVRNLPSFIACSKEDNVCREPSKSLSEMAKTAATVKTYDGSGHGARGMAAEPGSPLLPDLESWMQVQFEAKRVEREVVEPESVASRGRRR